MVEVTLFAIRNRFINAYLPKPQGVNQRGGSFVEPIVFDGTKKGRYGLIPRMWATEAAAKTALTVWLKGKHVGHREYDDGHYYTTGYDVESVSNRIRAHMEIVPVIVTLPDILDEEE